MSVTRQGHQSLAILTADDLASLQETAHLLRPPKNARRGPLAHHERWC